MTGPGFGQTSLFPPEPAPDPLLCWLWLANTLGAGSSHAGRVLDVFGGAQEAWENRDSDAFRKAVGSPAFARANLPDNTPAHYRAFARRCAARNIRILPYDDPDYPLAFSRIPDMPLVLYCTGDPLWLNEPGAVGMVGSRRPTEYGLQAAADLGSGLAKNGAIIVSGLADGLDSAGHRAAVKENCPTIGVLGVPIDRTYPASNRELRKKIEQKGCVISEYPPESGPVGPNGFLQRNRLIAALSSALVVVEAQEKSGTMSTVNHAERYGKPVFVVPGSIYSPNSAGTNALLREGRAKAVCKPGDLFGVLGLRGAAAPAAVRSAPDPMSETERRVLACVGPKAKGVERSGLWRRQVLPAPFPAGPPAGQAVPHGGPALPPAGPGSFLPWWYPPAFFLPVYHRIVTEKTPPAKSGLIPPADPPPHPSAETDRAGTRYSARPGEGPAPGQRRHLR